MPAVFLFDQAGFAADEDSTPMWSRGKRCCLVPHPGDDESHGILSGGRAGGDAMVPQRHCRATCCAGSGCKIRTSIRNAMNLSFFNAPSAPVATGGYSQAVEVSEARRLLFISGQIPETRSGAVPEGFAAQASLVWGNLFAQLEAAGLSASNLVKVTTFLSSREFAIANREARQQALGAHTPALTVVIAGIFDEKWLLEIEAIAAE